MARNKSRSLRLGPAAGALRLAACRGRKVMRKLVLTAAAAAAMSAASLLPSGGGEAGTAGSASRRVVVMDLVEQAAAVRAERTVMGSRRAARIGERLERGAALAVRVVADDQVSRDQKHLFPIIVHERPGREGARRDAQQPRAAAALVGLVERPGKNLLLDSRRVAGGNLPAVFEIERMELVMRLVHRHEILPRSSGAKTSRLREPNTHAAIAVSLLTRALRRGASSRSWRGARHIGACVADPMRSGATGRGTRPAPPRPRFRDRACSGSSGSGGIRA